MAPGHEIIAEIEKIGDEAKDFKPGDLVGFGLSRDCCEKCKACRSGNDQLCPEWYVLTYDPYLGGYSTHMQVKASFVFHVPPNLDNKKAAPILCARVTVFAPLKRWGIPGARCGVVGIGGGLEHMAVQIANKMGMHVVTISTNPSKEAGAKE